MKIRDVMTENVQYLSPRSSLHEAAQKMADLDCGFLPVGDQEKDKLTGVITDRDITIRAVAQGKDPDATPVEEIMSDRVLYCYADEELESAADSMREQGVYRLIVLNNTEDKRLCGVISLGDIMRHDQKSLAGEVASSISRMAA